MRIHRANGKTVVELLMEVVAPLLGCIIVVTVLRVFTPLSKMACVTIGLPAGTVLGWGFAFLVFMVVSAVAPSNRPEDDTESS